jgi:hypothetical protein
MRPQNKRLRSVVLGGMAIACAGIVLVLSYNSCTRTAMLAGASRAQSARVRLLCETDHAALRQAGRVVLDWVAKGRLKPGGYRINDTTRLPPGLRFPQAILDLAPRAVTVRGDGYLAIEMHGGLDHFGVRIYPVDFNEPYPAFIYGDRKLLEGIWYCDEGYRYDSRYDEVINAILDVCGETKEAD